MLSLFGVTLPTGQPVDRDTAGALATALGAAATSLQRGAPTALAAELRHDAQRYLDARRRGTLRFAPGSGRACDEGALALMRLTVNAPPMLRRTEVLVA